MRRSSAHNLTSISSALAVLLLVVAHGGILPRPVVADDPQPLPVSVTPENDDQRKESDRSHGATPLDLRAGLPGAMLTRLYAEDRTVTSEIRTVNASRCVACGRPDPSKRCGTAASAVLAGAYRLISLRRDGYLALPLSDPFGEARAPRDPALTSSISILGPPSA